MEDPSAGFLPASHHPNPQIRGAQRHQCPAGSEQPLDLPCEFDWEAESFYLD